MMKQACWQASGYHSNPNGVLHHRNAGLGSGSHCQPLGAPDRGRCIHAYDHFTSTHCQWGGHDVPLASGVPCHSRYATSGVCPLSSV
jgi:hypothetical protein